MDATIKQELPPPGGYEKIKYARNPAKSYFKGMFPSKGWTNFLPYLLLVCSS